MKASQLTPRGLQEHIFIEAGDLEKSFPSVHSVRSEHKRTRLFEAQNDRLSILGSWKDQAISLTITLADLKTGKNVGEMIFSMGLVRLAHGEKTPMMGRMQKLGVSSAGKRAFMA